MENNSVSFYDKWLRETPTQATTVNSISEYLNAIIAINKIFPRNLFRGQTNEKWDIVSSAYRCLNKPTVKRLRDYHEKLVREITDLRDCEKLEGLEMVAHLQHNGSKTVFIDYTQNPLAALWFACTAKEKSEKRANACVYCIQDSYTNKVANTDTNHTIAELFTKELDFIYKFTPPKINRRILTQQSVFLIHLTGKIDTGKHKKIIIPAKKKQGILNELALIGISQKTLFHDFAGFVEWFVYDERDNFDALVFNAEKDLERANYKNAQTNIEKAIQLGGELKLNHSEITSLYNSLGVALYRQGYYPEALKWHEKALKKLGTEHLAIATTCSNIGRVYRVLDEYKDALKWYWKALDIREKILGKEHSDTATTYNSIGEVYRKQGDYKGALEYFEKALTIYKEKLGKEHPNIANSYNNIALVHQAQGEYEHALEGFGKALNIREKILGKEHPDTATTYNNMAVVYQAQGDYDRALEYYGKALNIREKVLGKEHPNTKTVLDNINSLRKKR